MSKNSTDADAEESVAKVYAAQAAWESVQLGNPIFVAAPSYEHTPSDLLGTFHNVSGVGFYFEEQSTYLRLQDNELYLNNDWQFDFETNNIYKPSDIDLGAIFLLIWPQKDKCHLNLDWI